MSRETEKVLKQLTKYMMEHQDELRNGVSENDLAQRFMEEYNASLQPNDVLEEPQTADDYMELAENVSAKKKKLEYLSKALELEPDNLDASRMIAEVSAKKPEELLDALSALLEKGDFLMEREGYFRDGIGEFWGILETRPYMRLRHSYFELLIQCGMMSKAVNEGERLLELCENDNLGIRYELMHLYAYFENEDGALALHKKYDGYEESQMLLPLAVLYYKKGIFERSIEYLRRLAKVNKDAKRFFRIVSKNGPDKLLEEMGLYGYRPFTIEELIDEYLTNRHLFDSASYFFDWAYRNMRKPSQPTAASK